VQGVLVGIVASCEPVPKSFRILVVRAWQIFAVGVAALSAALLFPMYEPLLAGLAAAVMVVVVALGFLLKPRKDTFYLRTTVVVLEPDHGAIEHDRIAVRVEVTRLWLLFLPTFAAVAFLVVTSAHGTTWRFSLLNRFWYLHWYPVVFTLRLFLAFVVGVLSTWVSERWVFSDAEACSADSVSTKTGGLLYSFRDRSGEYFGGEGFPFARVRSPQLARIVFYRPSNPKRNKIAMVCLFHRPVITGHGVADLDDATVAACSVEAQPAVQPF
jgi:hypothetical protein